MNGITTMVMDCFFLVKLAQLSEFLFHSSIAATSLSWFLEFDQLIHFDLILNTVLHVGGGMAQTAGDNVPLEILATWLDPCQTCTHWLLRETPPHIGKTSNHQVTKGLWSICVFILLWKYSIFGRVGQYVVAILVVNTVIIILICNLLHTVNIYVLLLEIFHNVREKRGLRIPSGINTYLLSRILNWCVFIFRLAM